MKIFLSCCIGFILFGNVAVHAAPDTMFSDTYQRIHDSLDTMTLDRVSAMLHVDREDLRIFLVNDQRQGTLFSVCRKDTDTEDSPISTVQEQECLTGIRDLWNQERASVKEEHEDFEQSLSFARWWDMGSDTEDDIDVLTNIHIIDRQFFGKNASKKSPPLVNMGVQDTFRLAPSEYRIPADALPFSATGGCPSGQTSLYGGLVCIPKFCSDFLCIKVRAIPERGSMCDHITSEASLQNLTCALAEVAKMLADMKHTTPTRITNQAHWFDSIFSLDQLQKISISFEPKTPPLIAGFSHVENADSVKKKYTYTEGNWQEEEVSEEGEEAEEESLSGSDAEQEQKTQKIFAELQDVRKNQFQLCKNGAPDCKSEDVLHSLQSDCRLAQGQLSAGVGVEAVSKCASDVVVKYKESQKSLQEERWEQMRERKREFFDDLPTQLNVLFGSIEDFENTLLKINLCRLQDAKNRCGGGPRRNCSLQ